MRWTTCCLLFFLTHIFGSVRSQDISLSVGSATLESVFKKIEQQTGLMFVYTEEMMHESRRVSLSVKKMPVRQVLDSLFSLQPLTYEISQHTVLVFPRPAKAEESGSAMPEASAQSGRLTGMITDTTGKPVPGASVRILPLGTGTFSAQDGAFEIKDIPAGTYTVMVSCIGFERISRQVTITGGATLEAGTFRLRLTVNSLEGVSVVSTGYENVPPERATGSFVQIDRKLFNRSVSTDILSRLEGVTSGLDFERRQLHGVTGEAAPENRMRIRGVSTIESNSDPLIILDNFPYEGSLYNINPNDVESITVLRDAAAASIWGARAGNGVIVITTKKGTLSQRPRISLNSNITVREKPDLYYKRNYLPSSVVMDIEKEKFNRGIYTEVPEKALPAYVELLFKQKNGEISDAEFSSREAAMRQTDVREEALRYLYQPAILQQYSMNVSGGGDVSRYYISGGYDRNREHTIGDTYRRLSLNVQHTLQLSRRFELNTGLWLSQQYTTANGLTMDDIGYDPISGISPYTKLADDAGNPLPVTHRWRSAYTEQAPALGLLDWQYRPLAERELTDRTSEESEARANLTMRYTILNGLHLQLAYQYINNNSDGSTFYDPASYYVRDLVNRYTQPDGKQIIPYGGILSGDGRRKSITHSGRVQANYNRAFGTAHEITALAGGEVRNMVRDIYPGYTLYNYDKDLMTHEVVFDYLTYYPMYPSGSGRLPQPARGRGHYTDRYLSYFGNMAYTWLGRYILSGSLRYDASNLFGVKTNQKGTPLWSGGISWDLSRESFFRSNIMEYLRLRATYGYAGNVNKNVKVFPTVSYVFNDNTGLQEARLTAVGNPSLRWEKVKTWNMALDFRSKGGRIKGNVEVYGKHATDLIGTTFMDPTTGIYDDGTTFDSRINYAAMKTKGVDVQLTTQNLKGRLQWTSDFLFSYTSNRITRLEDNLSVDLWRYGSLPSLPVKGKSLDAVYALPWAGLDHDTGLPVVMLDGEKSTDYATYYNTFKAEDLLNIGVSVPRFSGSLRNTFTWKNVELSALMIWKAGYVFKRSSIAPGAEYEGLYHSDYFRRWQQPGDEAFTQVPAASPATIPYASVVYTDSEALYSKGDHIRLRDINLSYVLNKASLAWLPVQSARIYLYARDLGILWRANKHGLDPDYPTYDYPPQRSLAAGIQIGF